MTLRARIWLLLLVALVLLVISGMATRAGFNTVAATSNMVATRLQPALDSVTDVNTSLAQMDTGVTSYTLTGDPADLADYVAGSQRVRAEYDELSGLVSDDQELGQLLGSAREAFGEWRRQGSQPIVEAARSGDRARARELLRSGTSRSLYSDVRTYSHALDEQIRQRVTDAVAEQGAEFVRLSLVLNARTLMFFALLAAFALLLLRGVLKPLRSLSRQMIYVARAGHHETPITPSGPPELHQVGRDAEAMRRELVREVDRARQADEGLEQQTPVVAAIRAELSGSQLPQVAGLDVAGVQHPAEGVVAGDWWSATQLPDGRLAVALTDVSGHGPAAGMEALRLKHVLERSLMESGDPALALQHAADGFTTPTRFATCIIVIVDPGTGELVWANAGHPPGWLVGAGVRHELEPTGPLLSVLGGQWITQQARLEAGHLLLMWTDGLTESRDEYGDELAEDGLAQLVDRSLAAEHSCAGIVAHLLAAARSRSADWRRDDVTCVAVRRV